MDEADVLIIVPDFSSNALGRPLLIADMLEPELKLHIAGLCSRSFVWRPVVERIREFKRRLILPPRNLPFLRRSSSLLTLIKEMIRYKTKAFYVFKPLITSFGASLVAKMVNKAPLILDIDDWELGFVLDKKDGARKATGVLLHLLLEHLTRKADEITVSSHFLKKRFGGHYIPHAVNCEIYDPRRYDRDLIRESLGISDDVVIAFIGTPRKHKGLDILLKGLATLLEGHKSLKKLRFMFTGDPDDYYVKVLLRLSLKLLGRERILFLGLQPKSREPELILASDIIVIPQRRTYATLGQVPAKVFTAMSMERPIIASAVSDLPVILRGCGLLVEPDNVYSLVKSIAFLASHPDIAKELGKRARIKCIKEYSYQAVKPKLLKIIKRAIDRN